MALIVDSLEPILVVGAGPTGSDDRELIQNAAGPAVAADGGARHCLAVGRVPEAVIGDFDSAERSLLERIPADRLHPIEEQDTTDFDKALRSIDAPLIVGVGFIDGRLDHQMACMTSLLRNPDKRCVLLGAEDALCLAPPRLSIDLEAGDRVSLYPLLASRGTSRGLAWPIDGLDLAPDGRVGTSNVAQGPVRIEMSAPTALLMLPRTRLDRLSAALLDLPEGWPARAER